MSNSAKIIGCAAVLIVGIQSAAADNRKDCENNRRVDREGREVHDANRNSVPCGRWTASAGDRGWSVGDARRDDRDPGDDRDRDHDHDRDHDRDRDRDRGFGHPASP